MREGGAPARRRRRGQPQGEGVDHCHQEQDDEEGCTQSHRGRHDHSEPDRRGKPEDTTTRVASINMPGAWSDDRQKGRHDPRRGGTGRACRSLRLGRCEVHDRRNGGHGGELVTAGTGHFYPAKGRGSIWEDERSRSTTARTIMLLNEALSSGSVGRGGSWHAALLRAIRSPSGTNSTASASRGQVWRRPLPPGGWHAHVKRNHGKAGRKGRCRNRG